RHPRFFRTQTSQMPDLSPSLPAAHQLTTFSYTPEHVQEFTDSALRYYVDPPPGANLSYGFERWV
ncbi:hypothetical protein CPB84DRAFT_1764102, partial [Gymnopilus junonius]